MLLQKKIFTFADVTTIDRHIEILLLENDCVIVPGLGGFVAHHIVSRYDEREALFLPPYRTLGFNPQLIINDSLLAQSYVEAYDISFPEAMHRIEAEVGYIQKELATEGVFELNDLGKLIWNNDGAISFEPFDGGILTPSFYALNSFEFNLKKKELNTRIINKSDSLAQENHKEETVATAEIVPLEDKRISIRVKTLRNIAVAAIFIGVALIMAFPLQHRRSISEIPVKSGVFSNLFDSSNTPAERTIPVGNITKPAEKMVQNHYWALVLASHVTEKNAQAYAAKLMKEGFSQTRVYENTGSIKVLYGSYDNQEEAYTALRSLKGVKYFKEAWIIELDK